MKFTPSAGALTLASLAGSALAGTYTVSDNIVGDDFYSAFTFEAIADPTDGRVNYVDEATAQSLNLTYTTSNTFIMRADDTTVLTASGPGRNSVRIKSNTAYTTHAVIFGMNHMPEGCGTWPAVWETDESNWPDGGEVDIVEGVNNVVPNQSTLHTSPDCTIPSSGGMLGTVVGTDCDATVNGNAGCGIQYTEDDNSFGPDFNNVGGGWYAMERTNDAISVWFWERSSSSVPAEVSSGASSIDTSTWGTPAAYFPDTDCDLATHFDANNIIINLTFCGDWAGSSSVYAASGCPSTCVDYVNDNPTAFTNAYFEFASINVYT
ncbi:glycoside hydrolase family 16 protein [Serpula lacrymans var. lacrymans S7.3]|uniref:Glycoside hydrolase family 16 protein n=2 Tax=Serpula lacrymans var. lacrymans TaxID=341189 RepID=F8Q286_SERL3|nr:glycoside hydrolase family 16 protein [Serpula lacrymans var. lacrymans S7.9]EGN97297.1 glycoside hydrolase family 16 protein [Serpula lacrymans var. lacrymans S7.3]EGO22886.1 glycoside hydrolase family 16 protein [Serpula lacrymans var. lacrymans S7.9]